MTPFIQVNDTHLHAQVASALIVLENAWAHSQRMRWEEEGRPQATPQMSRAAILELVQAMWMGINHERVATKGYRQTGPELSMRGPLRPLSWSGTALLLPSSYLMPSIVKRA